MNADVASGNPTMDLAPTSSAVPVTWTDEQKATRAAEASARQKSLEMLYDYTKFHIGVYLTLTGSYLTAAFANFQGVRVIPLDIAFVPPTVLFVMLAGFAGGVIVSSLTQTVGGSSQEFLETDIGPWDVRWRLVYFKARWWTYIEHTAFWIGLVLAVLSFHPAKT